MTPTAKWMSLVTLCCVTGSAPIAGEPALNSPSSEGIYRLPYADGTLIKVFDDFTTHRPRGRLDFFAVEGSNPYRIVAARRAVS